MKKWMIISVLVILSSCSGLKKSSKQPVLKDNQTFLLKETSTDKTYGFTEKNPVKVGGVKKMEGPTNEHRYLNALAGPNGEEISYSRVGSCCPFNTPNGMIDNKGLLDKYKVEYEGIEEPVFIYINMYDADELKAPFGFTIRAD